MHLFRLLFFPITPFKEGAMRFLLMTAPSVALALHVHRAAGWAYFIVCLLIQTAQMLYVHREELQEITLPEPLADRLKHEGFTSTVHIEGGEYPSAYYDASNRIVVSEGLCQMLSTEELQAVISHEAGHAIHKDIRTAQILEILYSAQWALVPLLFLNPVEGFVSMSLAKIGAMVFFANIGVSLFPWRQLQNLILRTSSVAGLGFLSRLPVHRLRQLCLIIINAYAMCHVIPFAFTSIWIWCFIPAGIYAIVSQKRSHSAESRADAFAASIVGAGHMQSALMKLKQGNYNDYEESDTHPDIESRIQALEAMK